MYNLKFKIRHCIHCLETHAFIKNKQVGGSAVMLAIPRGWQVLHSDVHLLIQLASEGIHSGFETQHKHR